MLNWRPTPETADRLDSLVRAHRLMVRDELAPLIAAHYPALPDAAPGEYRKMLELSAKMTLVGHACTEIAGFDFDSARQGTAALFGASSMKSVNWSSTSSACRTKRCTRFRRFWSAQSESVCN